MKQSEQFDLSDLPTEPRRSTMNSAAETPARSLPDNTAFLQAAHEAFNHGLESWVMFPESFQLRVRKVTLDEVTLFAVLAGLNQSQVTIRSTGDFDVIEIGGGNAL